MSEQLAIEQSQHIRLRLQGDQLTFIDSTCGFHAQHRSGSLSSVRSVLEQGSLTEARLESAISQIEDLIIPIIRSLPKSKELKASGFELAKVINSMSATEGVAVSIESVESLFNQLADYAGGSPVAWSRASSPTQIALGLVVLREVMQHGGFRSVSLLLHTK